MSGDRKVDGPEVRVSGHGAFPEGTVDYAREKVTAVFRFAHEPVLLAWVRLTKHADPAVRRPVVVQATLDVNGRLVRAVAEGRGAPEAIDLVQARLRHLLERAARHWAAGQGARPPGEPHEWRHGTPRGHRPRWFPRPVEEREIVRHKSFTPARTSLDEAAFEMDRMGYDFHLFTEESSGRDSVLYRAGRTGYRPAPLLTVAEAVRRLEDTGLPFVFYLDAEHARAHLVYHRYDGHYGLLSPPD
ncbi:hypothetical protein JOF53_007711 [Crossiella equi]|uniref:Sigma 54 modulation/S30EA ribosomal protein C-terminal domain-containing protein n=1 Tax=Crossiella equi TaxID=130796 RepID=A0ABS5ARJ3_9PSEU|nr:sigma 54 modulation/S30EA ribosomal C-terminal domain-containing protein [Crossiella equi]MBP2478839.1 hypothetical protein [Crossiella equi]